MTAERVDVERESEIMCSWRDEITEQAVATTRAWAAAAEAEDDVGVQIVLAVLNSHAHDIGRMRERWANACERVLAGRFVGRMMRARIALTTMAVVAQLFMVSSADATLVSCATYQFGFICASDLRGTIAPGVFEDDMSKLHASRSALIVVTHNDSWVTSDAASLTCERPPAFVLSDAIVAATPAVVTRDSMPAIARASALALGEFIFPFREQHISEPMSRVAFLLPTWESDYLLSTDANGIVGASTPEIHEVGPDMPMWVMTFGQPEYLRAVINAKLVSPKTLQTLASLPMVRDVTLDRALELLSDLITSAERATAVIPPRWGIGGGIDLWSVTRDGPHHLFTK